MDNSVLKETTDGTVSSFQSMTYALPVFVSGFLLYPVQLLLAGMYAKYFGLTLTTIASVVLFARLFDAITDPLIGYFSDRYRTQKGTRKPWVVIGGLGVVVSSYFLFVPPDHVSVSYFFGWYMALYLAATIAEIPHISWGGELANSSKQKSKIYSIRAACVYCGLLLYASIPMLPIFEGEGFTPETLKWSVLASAVIIIPVLVMCVKFTPNGRSNLDDRNDTARMLIDSVVKNRPLLILLSGFFLITITVGMYLGLMYIFVDAYLGLGEKLPLIYTAGLVLGVIAAGAVYLVSETVEKVNIYTAAVIFTGIALGGGGLISPGDDALLFFVILTGIFTFCNAVINVVVPSIMSDIADYGAWKFGKNRTATYFSAYSMMSKTCIGLGISLGLGLAGLFGFDPAAVTHTKENIFGLKLAFAYIPAILVFASLILVIKNPINARRHRIIQRQLDRRVQ